jgi:hypothetical protein
LKKRVLHVLNHLIDRLLGFFSGLPLLSKEVVVLRYVLLKRLCHSRSAILQVLFLSENQAFKDFNGAS